MSNKNCIIIHGCSDDCNDSSYNKHWISWIKNELIKKGIKTETPNMPIPWNPDYDKFKEEFEKHNVDENTILIGHSYGCAFLVRWLGEVKKNVSKLILVAPWKIPDEDDEFGKAFYNYPIDETIRDRVGEIVMFTSNDEEEDGKKSLEIFHEVLGGEIVILENHGHYTLGDMGTEEFPELVEAVLK